MRRLFDAEAELLHTLHALRYLTTEQLHTTWMPARSLSACQTRLSRLHKDGILERTILAHPTHRVAWSIGPQGLRELRRIRFGVFEPTNPISPAFIPHLIATNRVFLALAAGESRFRQLPFRWWGSHRVGLRFKEGPGGAPRVIRPDALISPQAKQPGPRVLLELDRSTECIRAAEGRRSIEGKLKAYRIFLRGRTTDGGTWCDAAFKTRREVLVVFVLEKIDARDHDAAGRDRRKRSIMEMARTVFGPLDALPVTCLYLDEAASLRALLKLPDPPSSRPEAQLAATVDTPPAAASLAAEQLAALARFFNLADAARQRVHPTSRVHPPLRDAALEVRRLLIGLGANAEQLASFDAREAKR